MAWCRFDECGRHKRGVCGQRRGRVPLDGARPLDLLAHVHDSSGLPQIPRTRAVGMRRARHLGCAHSMHAELLCLHCIGSHGLIAFVYSAKIRVNGRDAGSADNMFRQYTFTLHQRWAHSGSQTSLPIGSAGTSTSSSTQSSMTSSHGAGSSSSVQTRAKPILHEGENELEIEFSSATDYCQDQASSSSYPVPSVRPSLVDFSFNSSTYANVKGADGIH